MHEDIKCLLYGLIGSAGLYLWLYIMASMPGH